MAVSRSFPEVVIMVVLIPGTLAMLGTPVLTAARGRTRLEAAASEIIMSGIRPFH